MTTYKIVGDCEVAGKKFGDILTEDDLGDANVAALIEGGHVVVEKNKTAKADSPQEQ